MDIVLASPGFVLSVLCAGIMGYAIQRGATCTVAAVAQVVTKGRWDRFLSLGEAAIWVAGGILIARLIGLYPHTPPSFVVTGWTLLGGALLGAGAYVNHACVFGSIARIGARDWAYLATPPGFLAGVWLSGQGLPDPVTGKAPSLSPMLVIPFILFALWRIGRFAVSREVSLKRRIWAPHEATVVIGLTFVIMLLAVGAWAYTDLLIDVARGMAHSLPARLALVAALLAGSVVGGMAGGEAGTGWPSPSDTIRRFSGGMLMGAGSQIIPGGNDGLILVGMPFLQPHAWAAIGAMCATIAVALYAERALAQHAQRDHAHL